MPYEPNKEPPQKTCSSCSYFKKQDPANLQKMAPGTCYYNPPVPTVIGVMQSKTAGIPPMPHVVGIRPVTSSNLFCSKYAGTFTAAAAE
jgi:hypothetical protein